MELYEFVGEQIRHQRKLAKLNQSQLAELLNQSANNRHDGKREA
ncbi:repressor C1 [Streptococcus dysgalactiae subsp. equisimilis]|nr:repressor C1 [Streptococcus dysgalactiae subsp. equisimilis]